MAEGVLALTVFEYGESEYTGEVFLLVTNPIFWDRCHSCNVKFINSVVEAAKKRRVTVKFFTNWYDYAQITGTSMEIADTEIWYWHMNAVGLEGRTDPFFLDAFAFGPFSKDNIVFKQHIRQDETCGVEINRTVKLVPNPGNKKE
uniref:N-acetyllactosaminide alpha-1,3-galactosyltransferase n=1 Tax=Bursaphelenchus xylophilus TaxID=6326 RepID=A0A1I7SKT2_BURXY